MIPGNFHMHSRYSDGSDEPEEYAKAAVEKGFTAIGFSEHAPLPFSNTFALRDEKVKEYTDAIGKLQILYKDRLSVYTGMEADYIPGFSEGFATMKKNWNLDYIIGSVHLVVNDSADGLWFIDGPSPQIYDDGLNILFAGSIEKAVKAYFDQLKNMIVREEFDVIGHMDKVKMHNKNRYFREEEPWYRNHVMETLEEIRRAGRIVEINTRGIYKKRSDSLFPSLWVVKAMLDMKIPMMLSSDAHKPGEVDACFAESLEALRQSGVRELMKFHHQSWVTYPI